MRTTASQRRKRLDYNLVGILNLLIGLLLVFPLIYAFFTSFMPFDELTTYPPKLFPDSFTNLENYYDVFARFPVVRYMLNSLIVGVFATVMRIIMAMTAAFSFSFFNFKGKRFFFMLTLAQLLIPGDSIVIANYRTVSQMQLIDSYLGLMIIYFVSANYIFIVRQNMMTIPKDLRDASYIDGCSNFRFFFHIVVPCSTGIMVAVFISSFVELWNAYLWPLLVTNTDVMRTVQLGLQRLHNENDISYGPAMAGTCIVLIPAILVFTLFQEKIVRGITMGAVKG